jgi:hypothetical protein
MSRVLTNPFGSRRTILLLVAIVAAILLTHGVAIGPASRDSVKVAGEPGSDAATSDHAATAPMDAAKLAEPGAAEPVATESLGAGGAASVIAPRDGGDVAATDEVAVPSRGLDAPSVDARIIRSAGIELRVKRGHFEDSWGDAQAVAGAFGGYIAAASRSGAAGGTRLGTITMRVPTGKFDAAVERLRDLGATKVERLDISSEDVTQEYVDTKSRLRHDRAVEARLLALLAETDGVSEVLAVQARLDQVQEQIEVSRGRLQYLDKLTALSTISVTLRAPASAREDAGDDDGSVLGDAWTDARERFAENVASAIVWAGGALPTLLVLAALAVAARVAWRRRSTRYEAPTASE